MRPLGYIIIQAQVDRVQGYDEDQIALVIPDLSNFTARIPVILGTPTISWVINMMKGFNKLNILLSKHVEQEKVECQLGLEPRSLGVWPSAFTIRPPALLLLTAL